jgi:hypothetical protein
VYSHLSQAATQIAQPSHPLENKVGGECPTIAHLLALRKHIAICKPILTLMNCLCYYTNAKLGDLYLLSVQKKV